MLSSQHTWTGKDGMFDYQDFADLLFEIFNHDDKWTTQTIRQWNMCMPPVDVDMSHFPLQ
jgi:hypothetical protein